MSPEYVKGGNFSVKSDVYSFGVLMLEIICGRRNNSFYDDDRALTLVGHVCHPFILSCNANFFRLLRCMSHNSFASAVMGVMERRCRARTNGYNTG